jgi:hypothetical protein
MLDGVWVFGKFNDQIVTEPDDVEDVVRTNLACAAMADCCRAVNHETVALGVIAHALVGRLKRIAGEVGLAG